MITFDSRQWSRLRDTILRDKVCQCFGPRAVVMGSPVSTIGPKEVVTGSPVSTMNKTDDHDIYNIVNLFCDYEFLREISH